MSGIKVEGIAEKSDGGFGLLVGQHLGECQAGVVVDGDVQSLEAWVLKQSSAAAVSAHQNLLITGKALDIKVEQIAREGVFVALHGRSGMEIAPAAETDAAQDAANGGGRETGGACDLIAGSMLPAQLDDAVDQFGGWRTDCAGDARSRRGARRCRGAESADPLGGGLGSHQKAPAAALRVWPENKLCQLLSTAEGKSGILVDVHSISPRKLDCSSQSASPVLIEWTTS